MKRFWKDQKHVHSKILLTCIFLKVQCVSFRGRLADDFLNIRFYQFITTWKQESVCFYYSCLRLQWEQVPSKESSMFSSQNRQNKHWHWTLLKCFAKELYTVFTKHSKHFLGQEELILCLSAAYLSLVMSTYLINTQDACGCYWHMVGLPLTVTNSSEALQPQL